MRQLLVLAVALLICHHRCSDEDTARVGHGVEQDTLLCAGAAVTYWRGEDGVDDWHHGLDAVALGLVGRVQGFGDGD